MKMEKTLRLKGLEWEGEQNKSGGVSQDEALALLLWKAGRDEIKPRL